MPAANPLRRTGCDQLLGPLTLPARLNGGPTVADLAERYLEEHVAVRLKPRTQRRVRGILHNHILPALGRLPLAAVERSQVVEFH